MKKILYIASEAMPFASTGGLADVIGSLPIEVAKSGADVRVVMPLYGSISNQYREMMTTEAEFYVPLSWRKQYCGVKSLEWKGVKFYFIDNEYYFARDRLYANYDDGERFAFFSLAAIDMLGVLGYYPDVINANDWQSALAVIYLERKYRQIEGYENIRTVFSIHNIEYQGKYDMAILGDVFSLEARDRGIVEYGGCINLMKGAIVCADRVVTVSPRYSGEICTPEYGAGLENVLLEHRNKLLGILNGIDYDYYNPQTDTEIKKNYTWRSVARKFENKLALQEELGLEVRADVPLISIISRLVSHKGIDLVSEMVYNLLDNNDVQLVVLGCGAYEYEQFFVDLSNNFKGRVAALIKYDRDTSKRIYSSSDIFLMPSKSEPCGLSQMIASRYGAIPVVRETGGLYDSIKGFWIDGDNLCGNGFTFANYSSEELYERTCAAVDLWNDADLRAEFVSKIMRVDFSWKTSAKKYLTLYETL